MFEVNIRGDGQGDVGEGMVGQEESVDPRGQTARCAFDIRYACKDVKIG